jgi:hypothetical protein
MSNGMSNQTRKVIFFSFQNSAYTSTYHINLLFSLKQLKFIKPYEVKRLEISYYVYEGYYLKISSSGRWGDQPMGWVVSTIRAYIDERGLYKYEVLSATEWLTPWARKSRTVPILCDISNPGYHSYPEVDYNKIYSKSDVAILLKGGTDPALSQNVSNNISNS